MKELTKKRLLFLPNQNYQAVNFTSWLESMGEGMKGMSESACFSSNQFNAAQTYRIPIMHQAVNGTLGIQQRKVKILPSCHLESGKEIRYLTAIIKVIEQYFMPRRIQNTLMNDLMWSSPQPYMLGVIISPEEKGRYLICLVYYWFLSTMYSAWHSSITMFSNEWAVWKERMVFASL